jgi:hypothetical protein
MVGQLVCHYGPLLAGAYVKKFYTPFIYAI